MTRADCAALIMAAGSGERFGGETPKQYRLLAGKPVLRRTVETGGGLTKPRVWRSQTSTVKISVSSGLPWS